MQPAPPHVSRPRLSERDTRVPAALWDRIRFVILLLGLWACGLAVVWTTTVNPIGGRSPTRSGSRCSDYAWILVLLALEVLRQLNYLIQEHSKAYYRFWNRLFGGGTRGWHARTTSRGSVSAASSSSSSSCSSWTRSWRRSSTCRSRPDHAPRAHRRGLPMIFQVVAILFIAVGQFAAIFWFLSKGGIDTYMPDDLETRFSDVKGQDPVLERVQENMIFLEDPESIEERGGYVPGGLLLWGPPGTGKTLMAQAVAGETAKPFVFVDPGRVRPDVHGRRHPEGEEPLPQAPQARRALRRGDRVLRRGGLPRATAGSLGGQGGGWNFGSAAGSALDPGCNGLAYVNPDHARHDRSAPRWGPPRTRSSWAAWAAAAGWARCRRCCRRCPA